VLAQAASTLRLISSFWHSIIPLRSYIFARMTSPPGGQSPQVPYYYKGISDQRQIAFDTPGASWYNKGRKRNVKTGLEWRDCMNKRKRVANRKHRKRMKRLRERRQAAIEEGAPELSKGQMKRKIGPPVPPEPE
jgi:hypothetical protein